LKPVGPRTSASREGCSGPGTAVGVKPLILDASVGREGERPVLVSFCLS